MSEQPYTAIIIDDDIAKVKCGDRTVALGREGLEQAQNIADILNKEIAPMIEALDEKSLELMQANERIAGLEAVIADEKKSHAYDNEQASLGFKTLHETIAELEAALEEINEICERNMGTRIPNIEKVVMRVLAKKAGGNG